MIIKEWAEDDQPREKLYKNGASVLSNTELLAILIGSGNRENSAIDISRKILIHNANDLRKLSKSSVPQLLEFNGIGKTKAVVILAALELGRRRREEHEAIECNMNNSKSVFNLMYPILGELDHEEFWILLLNNANKLELKWKLSMGGITATLVDLRLIYKKALVFGATSMILCHNHPSGNRKPSHSDIVLTQKVIDGGSLFDIKILDHIIVAGHDYYSFADEGKL